jgi:glucose-6-phosphate dehydrogenase assembly protein OpcA
VSAGSASPDVLRHEDVPLDAIEPGLRALWRSLSGGAPAEGRVPVTRVVTVNLVVLAGSEADAEQALELSAKLAERHPSRVILVRSRSGPESVTAKISILCQPSDGVRQLCSEQIQLVASGRAALRVAQHVAPLFVADVPVVLWLPRHPLLLPVDEGLLTMADRVVVDARSFPETEAALDRLTSWIEGRREVIDLAWLRLERWRALTAQFFESAETRHDLEVIEEVEVRYRVGTEGTPEGRVEALYFLAWLGARLGGRWEQGTERSAGSERFAALRPNHTRVEMSLVPEARTEKAQGDLAGVTLVADGGRCRYDVSRVDELEVAEVVVQAPRTCPGPMRVGFPTRDVLELLSLAISGMPSDPLYGQALRGARALAEAR